MMKKAFIYGVSVAGDNFTDRVKETRRLKMDFENGQNVILLFHPIGRRTGAAGSSHPAKLIKMVQRNANYW